MMMQGKQHGFIGISVYTTGNFPLTSSAEDKIATRRANDFFVGWIVNPLVFGDYPATMKEIVGSRLPTFTKHESELVKGSFDFLGVIHYSSYYVQDDSASWGLKERDYNADLATKILSMANASLTNYELPILPLGMQAVLEYFKQVYGNPPIFIVENGQRTRRNTTLEDTWRVNYLHAYMGSVLDAIMNGSNTRGYFVWSFLDVLELLDGYESSYGFYYVDLEDPYLKRQPKLSSHWYFRFLKGESISSDILINIKRNFSALSHAHFFQ